MLELYEQNRVPLSTNNDAEGRMKYDLSVDTAEKELLGYVGEIANGIRNDVETDGSIRILKAYVYLLYCYLFCLYSGKCH